MLFILESSGAHSTWHAAMLICGPLDDMCIGNARFMLHEALRGNAG